MAEPPNKKRYRNYERTFCDKWLHMDEFKSWVSKVEGEPTRAFCRKCKSYMMATSGGLKTLMVCHFVYFHIYLFDATFPRLCSFV